MTLTILCIIVGVVVGLALAAAAFFVWMLKAFLFGRKD
jgi:hypothetical protein